jgi:hypothetical protein
MATISELLNQKLVEQLGGTITPNTYPNERKSMMAIDENKLRVALHDQAAAIRSASEAGIVEDLFTDEEFDAGKGDGNKTLYTHPDVGGIEVIVDIEHLVPDMEEEKYHSLLKLIEKMANEDDRKQALYVFAEIKKMAIDDEINVLYVLFRKSRLFDFSNEFSRELLVSLVANLCAYNLKGRALLKGILLQSKVDEHIELAIRSAGQIRAKEVLPEIYNHAKKERNENFLIICMEAIVCMADTAAAIDFLPIIDTIPDNNNKLIGQAINLSRRFHTFEDELIKPLYESLIHCGKRYLRPIYSEGIKSFGVRAIPTLAEFIRTMSDPYHIRQAAKNIGGIRSPLASETLRKLFYELPGRQIEILDGLSHTKDKENLPLMLDCIKNSTILSVKKSCIKSIASLADASIKPDLKPYLHNRDTALEAIYTLMRLGDKEAEEMYFDKLLNGTPQEQDRLENFTSLFSQKELLKVAKKVAELPDMDAVILLSALYKPNVLPKEIGPLLQQLLERRPKPAVPVRLAIYKIIGKFAGSEKQLLGASVLREALQYEEPAVKRELENIIGSLNIATNRGGVGIR